MEPKLDLTGIRRTDVVLLVAPILPGTIIAAAVVTKLAYPLAIVTMKNGALLYGSLLAALVITYAIGFTLYATTFLTVVQIWMKGVDKGKKQRGTARPSDCKEWQLLARELIGVKDEDLQNSDWENWYALLSYCRYDHRSWQTFALRMHALLASTGMAWLASFWINPNISTWALGILSGFAITQSIFGAYREGIRVPKNQLGNMSADILEMIRKDRGRHKPDSPSAKSAAIGK